MINTELNILLYKLGKWAREEHIPSPESCYRTSDIMSILSVNVFYLWLI